MRLIRPLLAVVAISALVWSPAATAKLYAPPGKAGTSEYAEDVPTAGGNVKTPGMGGGNKTAAEIDKLGAGKAGVRKLTKLGKTGAAAARFAEQTAPDRITSAGSQRAARGHAAAPATARTTAATTVLSAAGGSALSAVGHLLGGSDVDGIGLFLPVLLAVGLAAALLAVARGRGRGNTPQA